jgi:hypothetical protein
VILSRRPRARAEIATGFAATETRALQTSLVGVLAAAERATGAGVPVELLLEPGRDGRVVVVCRNVVVGFVPADRAPALSTQREAAGRKARLVTPGLLHRDGDVWRVWVGPVPEGGIPATPAGTDTLATPEPTVLGVPLRRADG